MYYEKKELQDLILKLDEVKHNMEGWETYEYDVCSKLIKNVQDRLETFCDLMER